MCTQCGPQIAVLERRARTMVAELKARHAHRTNTTTTTAV